MNEWKKSSLGELANAKGCVIQTGPFGSQLHKGEYQQEGVGVINPTHIKNRGVSHNSVPRVSGDVAERLAKHKVRAGDLLFARRGEIGRHALMKDSEQGWLCGTGCFLVRLNQEVVIPNFVSYFLSTDDSLEWLNRHASGVVMPNLSNQVLQKAPVQLPCLSEQQELSRTLSTVERAIEAQEQIIQTTTELKQALMQKLFSEGLRGEPQKETEIGLVPESWEVVELGGLGKCVTGSTPKTSMSLFYEPPTEDFIAPADLGARRYVYDSEKKISTEGMTTIRPIPKNAVMCVCIGSSIGKVGMSFRDVSATNQQINSIVCREGLDPEFVYLLLSYHAEYWKSFATFGPVPILSKGRFSLINVPIPTTLEEQQAIAKPLIALEKRIETAMKKASILQDIFRSLLHELMSIQKRVKDQEAVPSPT